MGENSVDVRYCLHCKEAGVSIKDKNRKMSQLILKQKKCGTFKFFLTLISWPREKLKSAWFKKNNQKAYVCALDLKDQAVRWMGCIAAQLLQEPKKAEIQKNSRRCKEKSMPKNEEIEMAVPRVPVPIKLVRTT